MRNFSKLNTSLSSANSFKILLKNVLLCDLMTAFAKVSKILAEFNEVFRFDKIFIYVLPHFNQNLTGASCYLYFLIGNLTQNGYSGRFCNVNKLKIF